MASALDSIIDRIDVGELEPRSHAVVRRLASDLPTLSPLGTEVVRAFDQGRSVGNSELTARLWDEIESVPLDRQGAQRLLVALVHPDPSLMAMKRDTSFAGRKSKACLPRQSSRRSPNTTMSAFHPTRSPSPEKQRNRSGARQTSDKRPIADVLLMEKAFLAMLNR